MTPRTRRRTARQIMEAPDEGHKLHGVFRGANHAEIQEVAHKAAAEFFGEDPRYIFLVEGFEARSYDGNRTYQAELTIKRARLDAEEWDERLRQVIREHEDDDTTTACHAHEEDRPCCIDFIANLDTAEFEDRPTRAD